MQTTTRVIATAPGSIGNVGPGLDILGLAVTGPGDSVMAELGARRGVELADAGHPDLPRDPERHSSAIAAREVLRIAGARDIGIRVWVRKRLPLSGGQGGSGASAVAGAAAANALLGKPLGTTDLLLAALVAEATVAGRHADNIAPSLLGGAVLIRSLEPLDIVQLPVPAALRIVLAHPAQQLRTADARAVLPREVSLEIALRQAAAIAGIVAALTSGDLALLGRSIDDVIAEPARAPLLTGFREAKAAALGAGALGASISGAGPTAFAFAPDDATGGRIARAMADAYASAGVRCTVRVCAVDRTGVRVSSDTSDAFAFEGENP